MMNAVGSSLSTSDVAAAANSHQVSVRDVDGLISNWDFVPRGPNPWVRLCAGFVRLFRASARPEQLLIRPVRPRPTWMVYFIYAPDGQLTPGHRFTLGRLRDMGCSVLVVCAARDPQQVPAELATWADALFWKGLPGYDFSAYTLALEVIAKDSPGAEVFIMNDSVYGPFQDVRSYVSQSKWQLTGFTASSDTANHIQSYAFGLKELTPERLESLRSAFPADFAFDRATRAILWQELRFAQVASRHMSVGSYWFCPDGYGQDPTLLKPVELLRAGFPFMKKSLLGKHGKFQSRESMQAELSLLGHPI
jgi:hypothetical protein